MFVSFFDLRAFDRATTLVHLVFGDGVSVEALQEPASFEFSDSALIKTNRRLEKQEVLQAMEAYGQVRVVKRLTTNTYLVRYFDCQSLHKIGVDEPKQNTTSEASKRSLHEVCSATGGIFPFVESNSVVLYMKMVNPFKLRVAAAADRQDDKENQSPAK